MSVQAVRRLEKTNKENSENAEGNCEISRYSRCVLPQGKNSQREQREQREGKVYRRLISALSKPRAERGSFPLTVLAALFVISCLSLLSSRTQALELLVAIIVYLYEAFSLLFKAIAFMDNPQQAFSQCVRTISKALGLPYETYPCQLHPT